MYLLFYNHNIYQKLVQNENILEYTWISRKSKANFIQQTSLNNMKGGIWIFWFPVDECKKG